MTTKFFKTLITAFSLIAFSASAQDSTHRPIAFYSFIYNQVPPYFKFPLIGLINTAEGNQKNLQLGFTNITQRDHDGVQVGFTNGMGGHGHAVQTGFINAVKDSLAGAQIGFVNLTGKSLDGAQVGFTNLAGETAAGMQVGFVNAAKGDVDGAQVGFVNVMGAGGSAVQVGFVNGVKDKLDGAQVGFVNAAGNDVNGAQVGFVNATRRTMRGSQIGFINVADSLTNGVPVGFVSYVRNGGFKAIAIGASEMYPVNISFKTGVRAFYTTMSASFNPDFKKKFALGAGIGSHIGLGSRFFFNPEAVSQFVIENRSQQIVSLSTLLGVQFSKYISLVAGPSVSWVFKGENNREALYKPAFSIYENEFNSRNSLHVGANASLRFHF